MPMGKASRFRITVAGFRLTNTPRKKYPRFKFILTTLHAGGKFDGSSYITSGGLHGVGSSVVNALSEELVATIKRNGREHRQTYKRGIPVTKLVKSKQAVRGTGTTIFFRPDPDIFETTSFDSDWIQDHLEVKTYLNGSLKIVYKDEVNKNRYEYFHEGGISEYLAHLIETGGARVVHPEAFVIRQSEIEGGQRAEVALHWTGGS